MHRTFRLQKLQIVLKRKHGLRCRRRANVSSVNCDPYRVRGKRLTGIFSATIALPNPKERILHTKSKSSISFSSVGRSLSELVWGTFSNVLTDRRQP